MAVDPRLYLATFQNQRNLAHQASILLNVALLAAGGIAFVSTGFSNSGDFKDFDGIRRRSMLTWVSFATGLIGVAITTAVFGALKKAEKHDPLATDEQMSVRRTNSALLGCVGLSAIAIGEFILLSATAAAGFTGIAFVASLAGSVTVITIGYDIAYLIRPSRITLDEAVTVPLTYDEFDPQ